MIIEITLVIIIFELLALILCHAVYVSDARDEIVKHINAIDDKMSLVMDKNLKKKVKEYKQSG